MRLAGWWARGEVWRDHALVRSQSRGFIRRRKTRLDPVEESGVRLGGPGGLNTKVHHDGDVGSVCSS
jgi:hypothetical protein